MSTHPAGLITYEGLPGGNAHHFRAKKLRAIWLQFDRFLCECTDTVRPTIRFEQSITSDQPVEFRNRIEATLTERYGRPEHRKRVTSVDGDHDMCENTWNVPADAIDEAIDRLQAEFPLPKTFLGEPLMLTIAATFKLRDPNTGLVFDRQGVEAYNEQGYWPEHGIGISSTYIVLREKASCALLLSFPFPEPTEEFRAVVRAIQERLPFKLSTKAWKRWKRSKTRDGYFDRRIDIWNAVGN